MSTYLRTATIILVACVLGSTRAAFADGYSRLELDSSSIGFSSPGNSYGPWIFQNARYVFVMPGQGAINFEVSHQADGDAGFPTHGDYFAAGITHDFTPRFYGNFNFGYGTSNPYAKTDVHLEAAYKSTPDMRLVMDVAEDFVTYWSGSTLQQLSVGPTYYYDTGDVQLRYLAAANTGAQNKSGAFVAWDITPDKRSKYSITGLFGPQQYLTSIPGIPISLANYNGQTYTVSGEWQIGRTLAHRLRWGLKAGGFLSQINQATSGAPIYTGRGFTFGAWTAY
jgi:YaiO family outer membrane protein